MVSNIRQFNSASNETVLRSQRSLQPELDDFCVIASVDIAGVTPAAGAVLHALQGVQRLVLRKKLKKFENNLFSVSVLKTRCIFIQRRTKSETRYENLKLAGATIEKMPKGRMAKGQLSRPPIYFHVCEREILIFKQSRLLDIMSKPNLSRKLL